MDYLTWLFGAAKWIWNHTSGEFISSMSGALFGALSAFWFQSWSEKRKDVALNYGSLLKAQLVLGGQLNKLDNIKLRTEPLRNDPQRELKLIGFHVTEAHLSTNFDSLGFLAEKHANLIFDIHVAEQCFYTSMDCVRLRNDAYEKLHANSDLKAIDMETGRCTVEANLRDIKELTDLTNALYESVDDSIIKCDSVFNEIKTVGKKLFPKKKFLKREARSVPVK